MRSGRYAVWGGVFLVVFLAGLGHGLPAQRSQSPSSQSPATSRTPLSSSIPRKLIKESYEQMRKDAEHLYDLAAELRDETGKANEDVLSVSVVKKAEEIEKLAKKIQGRMKNL